jgi:glyoxylase-like metal-dependent hydrolase (beta-lactamase superfamily II)
VGIWRIGDITVTRVEEGIGLSSVPPKQFLTNFDPDIFRAHHEWMIPLHYEPREDRLVTSIHSWLIRTPRHTILLDTCSGNHKNRPWNRRFHQLDTPYLERLREAGVAPEDIDIVLCTHLHSDHCGWNTQLRDGRWVPTFPNAKYLFSRKEHDRWDPRVSSDKSRAELYNDSVLPVIESRQALILDGVHEIDDTLIIEPSPGHTIGHVLLKAGTPDDQGSSAATSFTTPCRSTSPAGTPSSASIRTRRAQRACRSSSIAPSTALCCSRSTSQRPMSRAS